MPPPRISGLLNNCALYSALPELLRGIHQLAEREAAGTLAELIENPIYLSYQTLRETFGRYYGIDGHEAFNWQALDSYLNSRSFYENEIIFSPVLRHFIAEVGLADDYDVASIGLLRDVQANGAYNHLHYMEAAGLLHDQFGISVQTYEYITNRHTENPKDNYNLVGARKTTRRPYPFGETPTIDFYYRGAHFEIQPHENLAEANAAYIREIGLLPEELRRVHDNISFSQSAYKSNQALGQLFVYVNRTFTEALNAAQIANRPSSRIFDTYFVNLEEYAAKGRAFHQDTYDGRQTFAVILLYIAADHCNKYAETLLLHMDKLNHLAHDDEPLAAYFLDKLSSAIIHSPTQLNDQAIASMIAEIQRYHEQHNALQLMLQSELHEHQQRLIKAAQKTMKEAWQCYKKTKEERFLEVIKQTQAIALEPTPERMQHYARLKTQIEGKGSLGKLIAGLMFTVLGCALLVISALSFAGSFGLGTPTAIATTVAGAALLSAGVAFFNANRDKGLYKKMKQTNQEAETYLQNRSIPAS
ncbi:hypothetical protein [Legionella nagasakiensis]|uniref:hypothetical protein n=1 Tax=Legionella nagasakiensis TaxID=535290 RepID=UPI0010559804|nr:hypothetical protein [Legionella nagasakiensis]